MTKKTAYEHGTFSWVELTTTDSAGAKKFYTGLFGWDCQDMPAGPNMTYTMNKVGNDYVSALYQMGPDMKGIPPHWASYITVESVDATAKRAGELGAKILKEPFDVLDVGRMAVL